MDSEDAVLAVVVADGEPSPADAAWLEDADLVIAADGGTHWLDSIGVRPNRLVGDLDSFDPDQLARLEAAGVQVERHPADKDASDTELAVEAAVTSGADRVVLLGALGGARLDHEVANLALLADERWRPPAPELRIVRGSTLVRAVHGGGRLTLEAVAGTTVTLQPIGGTAAGIRTEGLRYPLAGDSLAMGRSRGLSNEVVRAPASVSLDRGVLLVIESGTEGGPA